MNNATGLLGGSLIALVVIFVVSLLVGAGILMGACAVYNNLIARSSRRRVPDPTFGGALLLTFLHVLLLSVVAFAFSCVFGIVAGNMQLNQRAAVLVQLFGGLFYLPLYYFTLVALLKAMLPTTLTRALIVAGVAFAIGFVLYAILGGIALVIYTATHGRPPTP
jgi:hypothetical protein